MMCADGVCEQQTGDNDEHAPPQNDGIHRTTPGREMPQRYRFSYTAQTCENGAMVGQMSNRLIGLTLGVAITAAALAQAPSRAAADSMQAKLARIEAAAESKRAPGAPPVRTSFDEHELNAYFVHYGPDFLPPGVTAPRATLLADGRVVARAVLDLDAVRRSRERSLFDPLAYLQGSLEVVAAGAVAASDGSGVIRFESATVGGVAVPKTLAQELLRFYTRSPERPGGFQFDEPFDLPAGIRSVSTERGAATVMQ